MPRRRLFALRRSRCDCSRASLDSPRVCAAMTRSTSTSSTDRPTTHKAARRDRQAAASQLYHFYPCARAARPPAPVRSAACNGVEVTSRRWAVYESEKKRIVVIDHGEPADTRTSTHSASRVDPCPARRPRLRPERGVDQQRRRHLRSLSRARSLVEGEAKFYEIALGALLRLNSRTRTIRQLLHSYRRQDLRRLQERNAIRDSYTTSPTRWRELGFRLLARRRPAAGRPWWGPRQPKKTPVFFCGF